MTTDAKRIAAELGAELEARLLRELGAQWRSINYARFRSALRPPVIRLTDACEPLGCWRPELRSLELSRHLVLEFAWTEVIETLERLAIEQFVHERLGVDEHRRGPTYRRICLRFGVHPVPPGSSRSRTDPPPTSANAKVLARVHKLLALAGSPNRHEAEAAALAAQRLIVKFNLGRARLAERDDSRPAYDYRHLGPPLLRTAEHDQRLAKLLTEHFFVESAWVPIYEPRRGIRATVLEICGLEVNLLMAEHVHAFLRATSRRLWAEYRQSTDHASDRDRPAYLAGVLQGFELALAAQQRELEQEGLVWVPAPELGAYFRQRNPRLRHAAGPGGTSGEAFEQGSQAGRRIVLAPPVTAGANRPGPRKALGPAS